ncbi:DoxX family protein [Chryseobacterium sp. SNU WT5]|nr:DoxX family protein [Chryseobacterium sp. SNU WT5]
MKLFIFPKKSALINNLVILLVRIFIGISMIFIHVVPKLEMLFKGEEIKFYDFIGLGDRNTLIVAIILELVFSFMLIIGLFTRISSMVISCIMIIAAFVVNGAQPLSSKELSLLYLTIYIFIIAFGPGKYSIDQMILKKRDLSF